MEHSAYIIERLESMDKKYDGKLDKILEQTTKTNGRVTSLEKSYSRTQLEVEELKTERNQIKGRDKTLYVVLVAVGSIVGIIIERVFFKT